jgi:hypothetical protein
MDRWMGVFARNHGFGPLFHGFEASTSSYPWKFTQDPEVMVKCPFFHSFSGFP